MGALSAEGGIETNYEYTNSFWMLIIGLLSASQCTRKATQKSQRKYAIGNWMRCSLIIFTISTFSEYHVRYHYWIRQWNRMKVNKKWRVNHCWYIQPPNVYVLKKDCLTILHICTWALANYYPRYYTTISLARAIPSCWHHWVIGILLFGRKTNKIL